MSAGLGAVPGTWWRWYLGAGGGLVVLHFAVPPLADPTYVAIGLLGLAGVGYGTRVNQPRHAAPWWCFAGGLALWVVADLLFALEGAWASTVSDLLFVSGYVPLTVGLLLMGGARVLGRDLAGVLDACMFALALTLLIGVSLVEPLLTDSSFERGAIVVELCYLLGDLLLLGGLVRIATTPGSWIRPLRGLAVAIGLVVAADATSLAMRMYGGVEAPTLPDVGYLLSYLFWGAAALHPRMLELTERGRPKTMVLGHLRMTFLGVAATTGTTALAVQTLLGVAPSVWPVVVGTAVIVGLVLLRLRLAFDEIVTANEETLRLRDRLAFEASHDSLTGLPNRAHGLALIESALDRVHHRGGSVTVMFVDLDGFKLVNDTFGHRGGDALLKEVADRLLASVRDGDEAVRLGGDEFVVLMTSLQDPTTALSVAERIIARVSEPITLGTVGTTRVGASVGVAQCFDGATDAATLLDEADIAAYRAKTGGKGRAELFDVTMREDVRRSVELVDDLRAAVTSGDGGGLELHYQPVIDAHAGSVRGWEALLRWDRPGHGRLMPGDFLPVAERSDLICDVDRWVLHAATAQVAQWCREQARDDLTVAVNITLRHARRSRFLPDVTDALEASGLRADQLVLELHEGSLVPHGRAVGNLARLRELGVRVAFADFGAGFGALAGLADLPVDVVKINGDFLEVGSSTHDKLLHLMIQGAHAVGLTAVAEGVERDDQLATLRSLDCEMVQGFHLAAPMPPSEAARHLADTGSDRFSGLRP